MKRAVMFAAMSAVAFGQPPKFVPIPAGSFVMGCEPALPCSDSLPRQRVFFDRPFQIMDSGSHRAGQWREFVRVAGYRSDAEKAGDARTWRSPGFPLDDRQPVVYMTLNDATAYCESMAGGYPRRPSGSMPPARAPPRNTTAARRSTARALILRQSR